MCVITDSLDYHGDVESPPTHTPPPPKKSSWLLQVYEKVLFLNSSMTVTQYTQFVSSLKGPMGNYDIPSMVYMLLCILTILYIGRFV